MVLECVVKAGFISPDIRKKSLISESGNLRMSLLERRTVKVPNLMIAEADFLSDDIVKVEKFIGYLSIPLIADGRVNGVLEIYHRSVLNLNRDEISFAEMLADRAAQAINNALLFGELEKAKVELAAVYESTIEGWLQVLEMRGHETQGHTIRVVELTLRLAVAMGLSDQELQDLRRGVLMHDIGKMGVPDSVLHKTSPLTDEEWGIFRKHPQFAYNMLRPISYLRNSLDIPYCHHENWDGTGYPRGLRGEDIPLAARIFSVVDIFDALTSERSFRRGWSNEKALEYIQGQSGKHLDPRIVEMFVKLMQSPP